VHTRAPSASRTAPKPAAARSDAAVAPIPSALAAARSTSPAQWHGSHENDLIGVQHFTPNQPFWQLRILPVSSGSTEILNVINRDLKSFGVENRR